MSWIPPDTLKGWESKLTSHFLMCGADGNAQDIRWFEVTSSTLAAAMVTNGVNSEEIQVEVEEAFRALMLSIPDLSQRLEKGMMEKSNDELPGYFTYLVMTLLISSQFDSLENSNDFRLKLQNWLNTGRSYQNLAGVNVMWGALVQWLERRIKKGEPYRRLLLPEIPQSWSHIGYSLRLAFPRKADLRQMSAILHEHSQATTSPRLLLEYLRPSIQKKHTSPAMEQAYREFSDAWYLGHRTLADMPLWRLRDRAMESLLGSNACNAIIDMHIGFDSSRCYYSSIDDDNANVFAPSLAEALAQVSAWKSDNLGKAVEAGILFFKKIGHGRWRAVPGPDKYSQQFYIAFARKHSACISKYYSKTIAEDGWLLILESQSYSSAMDIFRFLKISPSIQDDAITRPKFYGGVRVPGGWLGLPRFLPSIESDSQNYRIYAVGKNSEKIKVSITNGQLISSTPLQGDVIIEPELGIGEITYPWRWRVRFFERAIPHPALGESARYRLELHNDWVANSLRTPSFQVKDHLLMEDVNVSCEELLEAVYATGASGWEEIELVALLEGIAEGVSVWHLIRCLHDAGFIEPRLRQSWKGRVWTLVKPSLYVVRNEEKSLVIVEGAVCSSLIGDFQKAVDGLGGSCFRRCGIGAWSPPVVGAELKDPSALSKLMGWPISASATSALIPLDFRQTSNHTGLHVHNATWSWSSGRFESNMCSNSEATVLTHHVHPGGRNHDVFYVTSLNGTKSFLSRTSAIIAAGLSAHHKLFNRISESRFTCLLDECGLPDALAKGLRRSILRNGGPTEQGYLYPVDDITFRWLEMLLPGSFFSDQAESSHDISHIVSEYRHSGGKFRLAWRNGSLELWAK